MTAPANTDLVLVGGGHSHALALRILAMKALPGLRITLVSPDSLTAYSGMLPGLIAGHYTLDETHIDLRRLCQALHCRFVRARVDHLDRQQRRLSLSDGSTLDYDWLSLDIGALPDGSPLEGAHPHPAVVPVKPVADFHPRWQDWLARARRQQGALSLAVVGGGAGGTEMALALAHAFEQQQLGARISLYSASTLLPDFPASVRKRVVKRLAHAGVTLHEQKRIQQRDQLLYADDQPLAVDGMLWCTGVRGQPWLATTGLACDQAGFIQVNRTLQSHSDPRIFAAGDCCAFPGGLPKAGVYAVRQANTLANNLAAAIQDKPLRPYRPQKRFLSLLSTGNQTAIASRGGKRAISGGWVWRWKDRIDRAFMAKFHAPSAPMPAPRKNTQALHCGGCGAKLGSAALSEALDPLDIAPAPQKGIEAGVAAADDAAVIRWPSDQRLVQSLDYFPAFLDEPYLFGRVAALHSLSDLNAMNARPHSALATVALPRHHPRLQTRDLKRLMAGAVRELEAADCTLVGGHTIESEQLAAGFTVNGAGEPAQLWSKHGGQPGDTLILTQPLGTGIQLASLMHGQARGPWLDATLDTMLQSNALAQRALAGMAVHACTDVTGFGLLGHLWELCEHGEISAELNLDALPLLPGTGSLIAAGVASTLAPANQQILAHCESQPGSPHPCLPATWDPQTNGGLLVALPSHQVSQALAQLSEQGLSPAVVGHLVVKDHQTQPTIWLG